jgi:hypothetical protein
MNITELADIELAGVDGQQHRLGDSWAAKRMVVVFLRHFG